VANDRDRQLKLRPVVRGPAFRRPEAAPRGHLAA